MSIYGRPHILNVVVLVRVSKIRAKRISCFEEIQMSKFCFWNMSQGSFYLCFSFQCHGLRGGGSQSWAPHYILWRQSLLPVPLQRPVPVPSAESVQITYFRISLCKLFPKINGSSLGALNSWLKKEKRERCMYSFYSKAANFKHTSGASSLPGTPGPSAVLGETTCAPQSKSRTAQGFAKAHCHLECLNWVVLLLLWTIISSYYYS